jgi:hypothetical protein
MVEMVCSQQCPQSTECLPFSQNLSNKGRKEIVKMRQKKKQTNKQTNGQPWTLTYTLVLQTLSSRLKSFFWFRPIGFLFKMMPCKLNHNLISLGRRPLSNALRPI